MADHSAIEWTDATWNPVRGCVKISPGCAHCYAETFAERFRGVKGHAYEQGFDLRLVPEQLAAPLRWKKPRRVFVNSMSDLFQDGVPDQFLHEVYHVMEQCSQHTFQVLTKRAERMRAYLDWRYGPDEEHPRGRIPSRHIWHGVSVENRAWKSRVVPHLVSTRSAVRFVSVEPLLEDLGDISAWFPREREVSQTQSVWISGVDWVIVGGESGSAARDCAVEWIRSIQRQCAVAGVPCFVKQLGARPITTDATHWLPSRRLLLRDKKGGDLTEWPEDLRVREYPGGQ